MNQANPYRILLVDDDPRQAELMVDFLKITASFQVDWAQDLHNLWEHLAAAPYDLILMDYRLPDGTGLEALEEIPKRGYHIPVVLVTGQGDERLAVQAIKLGAVDYLVKGSDYLPTLPALIEKSVRMHQLQLSVERSLEQVRYQALLLNNVRDAVVVWNTQGEITYWNPAAEALFEKSAARCVGQPVKQTYWECFSPPVVEPPRDATEGREIEREYVKDGRATWVSSRVSTLRDFAAGGKLIGYMDVARDITSRKKAESALRAERNFIAAVLDTVGALVVVLDVEGKIVRFNRACEQVTGYSFEEVRGRQVHEMFLAADDMEQEYYILEQIRNGHFPVEHESRWRTRDASQRLIAWSDTAIQDNKGTVKFIISTGLDITARRQAEGQIQAAQVHLAKSARLAAIGELAAGVAHHINNPLTAIIAESQMLLQSLAADHAGRESAEAIEKAGWRVQQAVEMLLDFSRPPSNTFEQVSVNKTIENALALIGEHIQATETCLEVDLADSLPLITGNARQLTELWVNLLILARDATLDGKTHEIHVASRVENERLVIVEITDNGKIIAEEELSVLFEPNFIRPTGGRGTGIELNLCQQIVHQHHGEISAASDPVRGTTIRVSFPTEVL